MTSWFETNVESASKGYLPILQQCKITPHSAA